MGVGGGGYHPAALDRAADSIRGVCTHGRLRLVSDMLVG